MKFISLDPGDSTGYAVWDGLSIGTPPAAAGTADLQDVIDALGEAADLTVKRGVELANLDHELVRRFHGWDLLVIEDWALYPWELQGMAWDRCETARGIGALSYIARASGRDYTLQPAAIKDAAEAGGAEEFFLSPGHENRHANDAIRHGVFYKFSQLVSRQQYPATFATTPEGASV